MSLQKKIKSMKHKDSKRGKQFNGYKIERKLTEWPLTECPSLSIITLNVTGLKSSVKRHRVTD